MNPQNGNLVFKLFSFDDNGFFETIQRNNYFSLIWIIEGNGRLAADFAEYDFTENSLLEFAPYQPHMISAERPIKGKALQPPQVSLCCLSPTYPLVGAEA